MAELEQEEERRLDSALILFYHCFTDKPRMQIALENTLRQANVYEEWEGAAISLDKIAKNDDWREVSQSKEYNFKLIHKSNEGFKEALKHQGRQDILDLTHSLRNNVARNLGNITTPSLYNRAYAGTKHLIEEYIYHLSQAVIALSECDPAQHNLLTSQNKLGLFLDARLGYGRTCLILQGGSVFGLCHLGVVKALHLRQLLPRIMVGTATGALMAALVGVHTDDELLHFMSGRGIDLSAFAAASARAADATSEAKVRSEPVRHGWLSTLWRRARRFLRDGYVLDVKVLEECVRANIGAITFEEAYVRTGRVLNITISHDVDGIPTLLNYLTAPYVLIGSAALASSASNASTSKTKIMSKNPLGEIGVWNPALYAPQQAQKKVARPGQNSMNRDTPLHRLSEMFNVNHFIVSQARPYIVPFLSPTAQHSSPPRSSKETWPALIMRLIGMEIKHQIRQMHRLGLLPAGLRRILLDETVPGPSWTLVPSIELEDFARLLRNPTTEAIDYWILKGEREVWPAVAALRVRCRVEYEIDRAYQGVRTRTSYAALAAEAAAGVVVETVGEREAGGEQVTRRQRASSMGAL
ncbi:hypothetical protein LTR62_000426 [Meristemomyces frigidus]|uniref:PNPLA domain-containing protein n=1 Tax=Meristemomyces frigidus TaxID=1508187 RepID=A0AAN7TNX4_9PEZI|nr:hypothetical protein LTR62_000426 [Meristemomyces frigidus]